MEIKYIDEFITLVEIGNYLEAADVLYLSQSTLSRHIQSIEKDLGVPLFTRSTRKLELNEFGKTFLPYAREIQSLESRYTKDLSNQLRKTKSMISIAAIPTMQQYHITDLLVKFQNAHPNIIVNIEGAGSIADISRMLSEDSCDFAFIRTTHKSDISFCQLPYFSDHLAAVFPEDHPLASASSISLEQLKKDSFLFLPKGSALYGETMSFCQAAGFTPHIAFTGHRAENILDLIRQGVGISILSTQPLKYIDTSGVSIVDIEPRIESNIVLAYKSERELSSPAKKFLAFFREQEFK